MNDLMPQRVWLVSELYYPEETSTGYYITKIAEGLADRFEMHVLCGQPTYSARGLRAPRKELHKGVQIERCAGTTLDKNVLLFRLVNIITLSLSTFFRAIFKFKRGDQVMVVTTPPSLPFIVAAASRLRGAKYLLLIHDNYPEILIAAQKAKENSALVRVMNWANRRLYKRASRIIVVGRDMKRLVAAKMNGDAARILTIPNWAELERVDPAPRESNALLAELGLKDKFVLLYAGNMGYPNDLESITWCAEKLLEQERFHFLFIGSGVKKRWLEGVVKKNGLRNVTILPPRPREDQTNFLNACDIAVISFVDKMLGVSMPSRTYNTLAAGKPMIGIADPRSELATVIEEEKVGWVVSPGEAEKLLEAIQAAESQPQLLHEMGLRARAAAESKYSLDKAVKDYLSVFETRDRLDV
ncbi:MAG: glycosyltransferase family 4 protein [Acidobacteria bacterium]|nr:glycosyltransferase family 4 protein [Acidobacteriota bacterium]